jgi:hypothetical protein
MPEIPVLKVNHAFSPPGSLQPHADQATRRLYEEASPSIVQVEFGQYRGSGFALERPDLIVTDLHCVNGFDPIKIRTRDGKLYDAKLKDFDDIADLALLEIVGDKPNVRPLKLADHTKLKPNDEVAALGHPLGVRSIYISPGSFLNHIRMGADKLDFGKHKNAEAFFADPRISAENKADLKALIDRPLLHGRVHTRQGNSGGPLLDLNGDVVGVADLSRQEDKFGDSETLFTPSSEIKKMLERSAPKFTTIYGYNAEPWTERLVSTVQDAPVYSSLAGLSGGAVLYGARGYMKAPLPRIVPGGLAVAGGALGISDGLGLYNATSDRDRLKYGTALVGDTGMLGGGLLRTLSKPIIASESAAILTAGKGLLAAEGAAVLAAERGLAAKAISKTGRVGAIILGVGLATRVASEFIPYRLELRDVFRTDEPSNRPPLPIFGAWEGWGQRTK